MQRRSFLQRVRGLLYLLGIGLLVRPVLSFVTWRRQTMRTVVFEPEEQTPYRLKDGVYLVPVNGELHALSARCTHLCCTVLYDPGRNVFHCPCHGSEFDSMGVRMRGRARTDLKRLPVSRRDNDILAVEAPI